MKITAADLIQAGMPSWDVNIFKNEWPRGVEVTIKNIKMAQKLKLRPDVFLAATLPHEQYKEFAYGRPYGAESESERQEIEQLEKRIKEIRVTALDEKDNRQAAWLLKYFEIALA